MARLLKRLLPAVGLLLILSPFSAGLAQADLMLKGKITDHFGGLIGNAKVTFVSADRVRTVLTTEDGQFALQLPQGTYVIDVIARGFKARTLKFVQTGNPSSAALAIALAVQNPGDCDDDEQYSVLYGSAASSQMTIRVLDDQSRLSRSTVSIRRSDGGRVFSRLTNERGETDFDKLEPGQYQLSVAHQGYAKLQPRTIWLTRENQTAVTVAMRKANLIKICQ